MKLKILEIMTSREKLKKFISNKKIEKYPFIKDFMNTLYVETDYSNEIKLFIYMNNLEYKCRCGCLLKFNKQHKKFNTYCSKECLIKYQQTEEHSNKIKSGITDESSEKFKQTCLLKFGTDHHMKNKEVINKQQQTNLEKYDTKFQSQRDDYIEKTKKTSQERYGTDYYNQTKEFRDNYKKKMIGKYGVDNPFKSESVRFKIQEYNILLFGQSHHSQSHMINMDKWNDKQYIESSFIENEKFLLEEFQKFFNCKQTIAHKRLHELDISFSDVKKSNAEYELIKFIESFGIKIEHSNRKIISPYEIDIVLPECKLAIEYNGLMFHSLGISKYNMFNNLDKKKEITNKHMKKTDECETKEYQLFHIFENEWLNPIKKEIWKSIIRNKINKNATIYARKCEIKEVSYNESKNFLNNNHIQGNCISKINIGLYYNNELIALMTFGKPRFSKNHEYELLRFCNKINYSVTGGSSKLLKYFEKKYKPKSLISYANRRLSYSKNNMYSNVLGFKKIRITKPNFFYLKEFKTNILYSRNSFQKHKLKDKLEIFDKNLTGDQNMFNNGYRKIHDSGNLVYLKEY